MSVVESKDSKKKSSSSSESDYSSGDSSCSSSGDSSESESESGSSDSEYSGDSSDDSEESDSDEKPESNENDKKLTKDTSSDVPPWTRDVPESTPAASERVLQNGHADSAAGLSPNQTSKLQGVKEKSVQHKSVTFKDCDDLKRVPQNSSTESKTKKQLFKDLQVQKETDDRKKNSNKCETVEAPETPSKVLNQGGKPDPVSKSLTPSEVLKQGGKPDPVSKSAPVSGDRVVEMAMDNLFDKVKVASPQDEHGEKKAVEDPVVGSLKSKDLNSDKAVEDVQSPDEGESNSKDPGDLDPGATAEGNEEQFCFCKGGEYGLMIQCENCSEWYHDECLQMSKQEISNIENFICSVCQNANKKLVTVLKESKDTADTDKDSKEIPDEGPTETALSSEVNIDTETPSGLDVPELESSKTDIVPKTDDQVSDINQEKGSSDEEWVDIAVGKDADSKTTDTEPCVNFIARTKEMLAQKNLEPEKKELLLPVTSPMDLKRNEFWDENFYKPHINEDLSSCFSQMSIDWENAKKIFCHSTISPLKKDEKNKVASENRSRPSPKTPLKGSAQNTRRELLLKDPTTPTRTQIVPSPADPEVMKIFERSLLVSPCKRVVRPKEKPSRRISLVKLDDQVTMNFGKSPSPTTAREMGKKLFSGKHDWSTHNSNEKENSSPKTSKQPQRSKLARKPLFSDKPLDPAWAKGLDEIKSDYPFYSLKKSQASELKKAGQGSNENIAKSDSLPEKSPEQARKNSSSKESLSKVTTTPKKSKIDDSHLFKTPTKSVRRMRKKSVSSDRQSEGWSPGAKLLEHSCPYDPTESGCYSQTVESNTPIKVPLAPSLDSIIKSKPESCNKNQPKDRQDGLAKRESRPGKSDASIENNSMDLSRSFDLEFDDCNSNTKSGTLQTNQSNVTVKTILPKLLSHLEKTSSSPQRPAINENEDKTVASDIVGDAQKEEADVSLSSAKSPEISMETSANAVEEVSSPSKCMRDVPSFIETPVEETLDFEENVASPATSTQKVLIGYGSEFCDEGEVFSSDDEESVMYDDIREAQRNALCDSPEIPTSEVADEKPKVSGAEGCQGDPSIGKGKIVSAETQKLLEDEEFLRRNKAKYGLEKQKEYIERSILTNTPEKAIANITPNKITTANLDSVKSMPLTSFKPIDDVPACSSFEKSLNEVKRPIASTPRKSVEERCDTPLSALHHDQVDREVAEELPVNRSITVPATHVEKFPKDSSEEKQHSSYPDQSVQSRSNKNTVLLQIPATESTDPALETDRHEPQANELSACIGNILRSCESLSNPSIERTLPLMRDDQENSSARNDDPLPSVTDDVCKIDHTSGIAKLLSSEEKMDDYSPAGTIHSTQITKTPLSAAVVRTDVDDSLEQVHKEADISLKSQLGDSRPQEGGPAVNMLLSSEETMSNWTPEPSPTEASSSDPLGSIPAKRRISLHDYVIRKEATSCTPTLPESSFSTPDFAKTKSFSADIDRPESPLAVEHDSSNFERTQSPVPMDHDGNLSRDCQDAPIRKRGELVAKLKYHHLIPIHIPPREFLYCKRVKVIQNMLINELISGVEFKNHQPITQPLYGSIAEPQETTCQQQCPLPGVPPRSAIRSSSSETNLNKHSTVHPHLQHRQLPAPAENIKTPTTSSFKTPSCSTEVLPSRDAPASANPSVNQKPQAQRPIDSTSRPDVPEAATATSVANNSGMGDPSVYDEESHDYFKNVKIPKVKRVTDTFMSDSSVLNSYDCGPDTLAVGQLIQQSIASDAPSLGLDSINLNVSLSNSQSALNKSQAAVDDPQTASTADIPKTISDLVNTGQDDRVPAGSFSTPTASSKNSADLDKITSYVKQCLFSEEGISRSPILPDPSNLRARSCSTPNPSRPKTSYTIRHPSFSSANTTNKTCGPLTTDLTPTTALDARTVDTVSCELPRVCPDYEESPSITPFPAIPKEEEDYTEPVVQTTETAETPIIPAPEPIKEKPPKYKIPKKKKPASAPPASSSSDPLLTSPNSIKKFISCSSAEPPTMSTLFTRRKKKQLDEILSKERAQREQVLQEYLMEKDEADDQTDKIAKKSEKSVKENVNSSQTRKRRKTDSPEPPQQFDLRQVLSSKSSAKPECKRAKRKSGETNKSDDTREENQKSERNRVRSDESNRRKSKSTREKDPQLNFKSKLFDALAVLNTRERNLRIPDKMAGRHVSLAHWLDSWKDDEIKLKELRTSRLQIRDPNYQPRDLSKLKLSQVRPNNPHPAKKMAQPAKLERNIPSSESVFGWKDKKPDSCNVNLFPAQSDASLAKPSKTVSTVPTSVSNPLLNKSNPLVKKKAGKSSDSKIPAPKIWVECMKRADKAHCNPKQIRKKTVLDIMTTKENGPLSTLQRALSANLKVTVVTRTFKGVRGECTGYLVAYDRYMNLALSDVTEHYRSLYHKLSDPEATETTTTDPSPDDKFQSGPSFVDFKRSVTVTFNQDVLREIRSPSQSPERAGDTETAESRDESRSRDVESRDQTRTHDETRSPGASIRSPSLSPPPSETSSPAKIPTTNKKHKPPPGLMGWAHLTPDHRKFKYTKNCITTRHCKQVFLRGDNVVLVRLVE